MSANLFEDLTKLRSQEVPVVLQSGTRAPNPRYNAEDRNSPPFITPPTVGTQPLKFMIHAITANEIAEADALVTAAPPADFQEQPSPTGRGTVNTRIGYNYEDPAYLAEKAKQIPLRDAAICLYGCTALAESTPGTTLKDKIQSLTSKIPAAVLDWVAIEITSLAMISAVGEEAVASFLAQGSTDTGSPSSNGSSGPNRTPKKKPSSKNSTAATSRSSKGKRRTTGG